MSDYYERIDGIIAALNGRVQLRIGEFANKEGITYSEAARRAVVVVGGVVCHPVDIKDAIVSFGAVIDD